jgi:Periplasmic binding protein
MYRWRKSTRFPWWDCLPGRVLGTDELIQEAGADAEGAVITQVVPPYYLTDLKTVALYRRSLSKYMPSSKPNFVSLEGFVDAMVIVEGLKKAGKELTREGRIRGIESVHDFDIGLGTELKPDYSSKRPQGIRSHNSNGDSRWPSGAIRGLVGRCTALKPDKNGNVSGSRILLDRRRGRKSGPAGRTPRA